MCHYLLITKPDYIPRVRVSLVGISLFILSAEFLTFYVLAKLATFQELAIRRRRLQLSGKYYRKYLVSLKIQAFSIGSFCPVQRILPFTIVQFVIHVTVTLLITLR